jgi:hypothetical protein
MKHLLSLLFASVLFCSCGDYSASSGNPERDGADSVNRETPYDVPGANDNATP